jgi:hypothetical protein
VEEHPTTQSDAEWGRGAFSLALRQRPRHFSMSAVLLLDIDKAFTPIIRNCMRHSMHYKSHHTYFLPEFWWGFNFSFTRLPCVEWTSFHQFNSESSIIHAVI